MLHREKVIAALEAKADRFADYEAELSDALEAYEEALAEASRGALAWRPPYRRARPIPRPCRAF
jgi:hypothetical protein